MDHPIIGMGAKPHARKVTGDSYIEDIVQKQVDQQRAYAAALARAALGTPWYHMSSPTMQHATAYPSLPSWKQDFAAACPGATLAKLT